MWSTDEGGNGHLYAAVPTPGGITWTDANAAARSLGGYLATLTTDAENQFAFHLIDSPGYWSVFNFGAVGPWIGGYQPNPSDVADGWQWVTGEAFEFHPWDAGQPDNSGPPPDQEAYLQFYSKSQSRLPTWNDALNAPGPLSAMRGYLVEFVARPGDANLDGRVDISDFGLLKDNFGHVDTAWSEGDFNGNHVVELEDFAILKDNFGFRRAVNPVPEPTSATLMLLGVVAAVCAAYQLPAPAFQGNRGQPNQRRNRE